MSKAPEVTKSMREEVRRILRDATPTPVGKRSGCGTCGRRTMVGRRDLVLHAPTPAGVHTIVNLSGGRCTSCGAQEFDAAAAYAIDQALKGHRLVADYETTITTVGRMPATYLKADLARVMRLRPGDRLRWAPLDRDQAVVRVERADDSE